MSERELALLDLHQRHTGAPPPDVVDGLAAEGLVRTIDADQYVRIVRRAELRAVTAELDRERNRLNTALVWPWRLLWRVRRIDELSRHLDALTDQSRSLRSQLHAEGLARELPELLTPLADGRYATLTPDGVNVLEEWAHSGAFDRYVDPGAGAELAGWCMGAYDWLIREWKVAYPPPTVSCAAALLAGAGEDRRDACLEKLIGLFTQWRGRYRECVADRLMLGALMVLGCADGEEPADAESRARDYQQALREVGFPLERETMWAGAFLALHGAPRNAGQRVHSVWRGLIQTGWSMSACTYMYAARLALAPGRPVDVTSRVQGIFDRISPRVTTSNATRAAAASVAAQSDLHPRPTRRTARILEEQTRWDAAADRLLTLHDSLPPPAVELAGADTRPVLAAILGQMPGSTELVREAFDTTLAVLRAHADPMVPREGDTGIDPLTGAALLLMDRGWHGRAHNAIFAAEACSCCRNEAWDELTIFRLSGVESPSWRGRPEGPGV